MNGHLPVGTARAAWLLARLRLRRLLNIATLSMRRKPRAGRAATAGKRRGRWILPLVMALLMLFAFSFQSQQIVLNLHCELSPHTACAGQASLDGRQRAASDELRAAPFSAPLQRALAMELWLLWLVALLVPLGSRELAQPDWDLEWLVTLPVRRKGLLWARILERSVANPTGWLVLWPALLMTGWHAGLRGSAPLAATAVALALLALAATVRTLVDTGLRLALPPSQLRNLQAAISVASMPLIYLVIALSTGRGITMEWARAWPAWTLWTPPGLAIQLLDARSLPAALGHGVLLALQAGVLLWAGIALLARQLSAGVVAASSREAARTQRPPPASLHPLPGTALQRRELRLLGRDRTFLVQSLVVPLVIIGSQLFFTGRMDAMSQLGTDQALLASIAFGLGSYVLLLSAFQTINTEGQALWLLYTFPGTLERMLLQKARLWAVLALVYPAAVFAIGIGYAPGIDADLIARIVLVALGIPVFALIAVALGVWASDPLAQEAGARIRPTYVYLYSLLAGLYGFALYTTTLPHRVAVVVLLVALALALWQKARDHLPYLLDPTAAPPPRVSAADGMVAALLFFAVQAIALALLHDGVGPPALPDLALSLAIGGAVVWALVRFVYWRMGTSGVPRFRHGPVLPAVLAGAAWALPAIAAAALYLLAARHFGIALPRPDGTIALPLLLAIACVAAPLSEEFIFRGLLFGGLRRSLPFAAATVVSAALFAVVHPPASMPPVFVLGLCAALAYGRNGSLLAAVVTHAVYNAAMIALQA
jgi:membrane protease YdiL (CAAX protease family)